MNKLANRAAAEIIGKAAYSQLDFDQKGPLLAAHVGCAYENWLRDHDWETESYKQMVLDRLHGLGFTW